MKESCARIVAKEQLIPKFVQLLSSAGKWLEAQKNPPDVAAPKYVKFVSYLIFTVTSLFLALSPVWVETAT